MDTKPDTSGSIIAIAALIGSALAHFGIIVDTNSITSIIFGGVLLFGIIKQIVAHKKTQVQLINTAGALAVAQGVK